MNLPFSVEAMVIDDSFISFCYGKNDRDVLYWTEYLKNFPLEEKNVREAKQLVLGISQMLNEQQEALSATNHDSQFLYVVPEKETTEVESITGKKKEIHRQQRFFNKRKSMLRIAVIATSVAASLFFFFILLNKTRNIGEKFTNASFVYKTAAGEKKVILLSDSTKIILNASSILMLADDFGKRTRTVRLEGEALFDVKHDESLPFIVNADKYSIHVLGTLFNVKAYQKDSISETSLLRGKVEIYSNDESAPHLIKVLAPKEKFVLIENRKDKVDGNPEERYAQSRLVTLAHDAPETNQETAWAENCLIFENKSLGELKVDLERWYNVKIIFKDDSVKNYRFTANFKNERIENVLHALQVTYPFHYKINGKNVEIEK